MWDGHLGCIAIVKHCTELLDNHKKPVHSAPYRARLKTNGLKKRGKWNAGKAGNWTHTDGKESDNWNYAKEIRKPPIQCRLLENKRYNIAGLVLHSTNGWVNAFSGKNRSLLNTGRKQEILANRNREIASRQSRVRSLSRTTPMH